DGAWGTCPRRAKSAYSLLCRGRGARNPEAIAANCPCRPPGAAGNAKGVARRATPLCLTRLAGSASRGEVVGSGFARPLVLDDLVIDLLALIEAIQSRALDRGNVHKHIRPALIRLDEAVALLPVEPFYSAGSHISPSRSLP